MNSRFSSIFLIILACSTIVYLKFLIASSDFEWVVGPPPSSGVLIKESAQPEPLVEEDYFRSFIKKQLAASEIVWQRYLDVRKARVGPDPASINPWPMSYVLYFWDYFLPTFSCPYTIQRIGNLGDGGKWVCGFELFEKERPEVRPCIIYSFGVAHESSFEKEFLDRTNCSVYAYDGSVDGMGREVGGLDYTARVHFQKRFIDAKNNSLGALMRENGHKWIDFLKMDIEGGEFEVLGQVADEFEILPFAQLHLEIHEDIGGGKFPAVYRLWERFEERGLRAFKNEVNHYPCVRAKILPIYVEYSFINIKGASRLLPL